MDLKYVLKHFWSICLSVKTFHDLSYSHRDIKPANILFNDNNEPVIIDLGDYFIWEVVELLKNLFKYYFKECIL